MKKFIFKVLLWVIFCLLVCILPSYFVDPYNVYHWDNIRDNGIEPNKNYIKTLYILNNPDKFNGYIFGSSRVGSIHVENITDYKIYNMTYSLGTPHENLETLQTFIQNGVKIDIVYLGVDSYSYTEDSSEHNEQSLRASYQYLTKDLRNMIYMYMDPSLTMQSIEIMLEKKDIGGMDVFYDYGWWCNYNRETSIDWENARASCGKSFLIEETLEDIAEIKALCDENDIKLVVFTNPMYELTYEESVERLDYLYFLERLASITDYYNFSGLNAITTDTDNYIDTSHYNAYVGDLLINTMVYNQTDENMQEEGFGFGVTENNVHELLEILQSQLTE